MPTRTLNHLLVSDVVDIICLQFSPLPRPPRDDTILFPQHKDARMESMIRRRTLLSCALTCRAFKQSAMDILWSNLYSVKPLLSLLPDAASNDELGRSSVPIEEQKALIRYYCGRIRHLSIDLNMTPDLADKIPQFRALFRSDHSLVTGIKSLHITSPIPVPPPQALDNFLPLVDLNVLQRLDVGFMQDIPSNVTEPLIQHFPGLPTALKTLNMCQWTSGQATAALELFKQVEDVFLSCLYQGPTYQEAHSKVLHALSIHRSIRTLTFDMNQWAQYPVIGMPSPSPFLPFRSLQSLTLSCRVGLCFDVFTFFIKEDIPLTSLKIHLALAHTLPSVLPLLLSQLPSLRKLRTFLLTRSDPWQCRNGPVIPISSFAPLTSMEHLEDARVAMYLVSGTCSPELYERSSPTLEVPVLSLLRESGNP